MDRLDLSPPSRPAYPTAAGADDVAPLSVVRPGKSFPGTPSRPIATSFARVRTERASAYLHGLNQHWHRHVQVVAHSEAHAEIAFPLGRAELDASGEALEVSLTASSNYDAALLEDMVAEALDRLAFNDDLQYQWIRPAPSAAPSAQASRNPRPFHSFRPTEGVMSQHGSRP